MIVPRTRTAIMQPRGPQKRHGTHLESYCIAAVTVVVVIAIRSRIWIRHNQHHQHHHLHHHPPPPPPPHSSRPGLILMMRFRNRNYESYVRHPNSTNPSGHDSPPSPTRQSIAIATTPIRITTTTTPHISIF